MYIFDKGLFMLCIDMLSCCWIGPSAAEILTDGNRKQCNRFVWRGNLCKMKAVILQEYQRPVQAPQFFSSPQS